MSIVIEEILSIFFSGEYIIGLKKSPYSGDTTRQNTGRKEDHEATYVDVTGGGTQNIQLEESGAGYVICGIQCKIKMWDLFWKALQNF